MADPTEDIPTDRHLAWPNRDFELRALRLGVASAGRIRAVVQLADQLHRSLKCMKATVTMVANVHHPPAPRTITIKDINFPRGEIRILWPRVRHPAGLHAMPKSLD